MSTMEYTDLDADEAARLLRHLVSREMKERRMTQSDLAARAGLSQAGVCRALNEADGQRLSSLSAAAEALGIAVEGPLYRVHV